MALVFGFFGFQDIHAHQLHNFDGKPLIFYGTSSRFK